MPLAVPTVTIEETVVLLSARLDALTGIVHSQQATIQCISKQIDMLAHDNSVLARAVASTINPFPMGGVTHGPPHKGGVDPGFTPPNPN